MEYYIVDAFSDKPFGGNPAGVVLLGNNGFPKEGLMLQVAAELRYSETAFVRRHSANEYTLRYFTPKHEVELCGHATVATFSLLHRKGLAAGQCLCHTKAGDLSIEADTRVMMQMAVPRIVDTVRHPADIYKAVGLPSYEPSLPVQIAYSGLADTFGHDGYTAHVRDFAPLYGVPEESATGTANAALTYYLMQNNLISPTGEYTFLQGEAMGRPSVVATRITSDGTLYVGGTAAIVAQGELLP